MLLFGKNIVEKKIEFKQYKKIADNEYSYYFQKIKPNKITIIKKLKSFTIHIIKSSKRNIILVNNKRYSLKGGEVFQFENSFAKIESINSMLEMLIVGTKKSQIKSNAANGKKEISLTYNNKYITYDIICTLL